MRIDDMELLVRVAQTGSMTQAAGQLHLTPAAVSAAVQRIEEALDVRIFERTTRSLHVTDEGVVVLEGCAAVLERWQSTLDEAKGQRVDVEGNVHLTAPTDTAQQIVGDVVAQLTRAHPKLRIVLDTSDVVQHLHKEAIDLAIRYGPLVDSSLTARKLATTPSVLVASPAYLKRRGRPRDVDELHHHSLVTLRLSNTPYTTWTLHRGRRTTTLAVDSALCGDGLLARQWALGGEGIALKSLFDVAPDLKAKRLLRVLPDVEGDPFAIHALFPSRRFQTARVRTVFDAIREACDVRMALCAQLSTQTSSNKR